ncbi:MAG: 1-acyl-sn-glycerol-3-phosphate acyltransferase [Muribaculaceae bacterium]|nr:1-acyl-sn-glycerol-3-phosphate acyltransferase [Muribaculaceae bacterium]
MNLSARILKWKHWSFDLNTEIPDKCVICVAPHTSNWDFILGELCIRSIGKKASFLMKKTWFFFPLGIFMRAIGGIPVVQGKSTHVTQGVVAEFAKRVKLTVAVTPEGTRSPNPKWHKGFLHIAQQAQVPVLLAYFDYAHHRVCIDRELPLTGDAEADLLTVKQYYAQAPCSGRRPEKFTTGL